MTVYVDDMYKSDMGQFKRGGRVYKMSHMIAHTDEELMAMAEKLGVKKWHQGDHYDITMTKRAEAVALGAVEIEMRELGAMVLWRRRTGFLPDPLLAKTLIYGTCEK